MRFVVSFKYREFSAVCAFYFEF